MTTKRYSNNRILAYSCLHFPFHDKRVFDFLNDLNKKYSFDRIIDLGDTGDNYCFSRYPKSPEGISISEEMKGLRKCVKVLGSIFPKVEVMKSNHCERLYSRATVAGIPRELIKSYRDVIGAPDGWRWHPDLTLTIDKIREKVYFCHERGGNALALAKSIGTSVVAGHVHSSLGLQYFSTPIKTMFAVQSGCLISNTGVPYQYNKSNLFSPMKGCSIIIDGVPEVIRLQ